jgi:hypothetical protein
MCKVKLKEMGFPRIMALEVELKACSILIKPTPKPLHHVKITTSFLFFKIFPMITQEIIIQWVL